MKKNVFKIFAMALCAAGLFAFVACSNASGGGGAPAAAPVLPNYTVTFNSNGGSEIAPRSVKSGQTVAKPDNPTKDHFNFVTWCMDEGCQTDFDFTTPITDNTTIYAKWSNKPVYAVTFNLNGGKYGSNESYTQNVETGSKITRPASDPAKGDNVNGDVTTKYVFDNWYADASCNTLFDFDVTAITNPTTVYAKWNETKYYAVTISNDSQRGSVFSDAMDYILAGTVVTLAASPKSGYELSSYTVTDSESNPVTVTDGKFTMPAGSVIVAATFIPIPLTFEAVEAGAVVTFLNMASGTVTYRLNGGAVQTIASEKTEAITLPNVGDKVCFFGDNATYTVVTRDYRLTSNIACDKDCYVYGNIMSLVNSDNYENEKVLTKEYALSDLFASRAYGTGMRINHIKNKPGVELILPATTLSKYCYEAMFFQCESLAKAPVLPAMILLEGCYKSMFMRCVNLVDAPVLPAATMVNYCYYQMFNGCERLASIICLAEVNDYRGPSTGRWLENVSPAGTFTKAVNVTWWSSGVNGIPSGWTVVDYQE